MHLLRATYTESSAPSDRATLATDQDLENKYVAIMNNESISFITDHAFSKLLKRPLSSRMPRDIGLQNSPGMEFHDHQYIDQLERCGDNDKEVRGNDGFGVVPHKSHPTLGWVCGTSRRLGHVAPDRSRRNLDSDFQQEFVGDTFLAPCGIVYGHFNDQLLQVGRHTGAAAAPRFPFPKHETRGDANESACRV